MYAYVSLTFAFLKRKGLTNKYKKCPTYLLPQTVAMALKQPDASW